MIGQKNLNDIRSGKEILKKKTEMTRELQMWFKVFLWVLILMVALSILSSVCLRSTFVDLAIIGAVLFVYTVNKFHWNDRETVVYALALLVIIISGIFFDIVRFFCLFTFFIFLEKIGFLLIFLGLDSGV